MNRRHALVRLAAFSLVASGPVRALAQSATQPSPEQALPVTTFDTVFLGDRNPLAAPWAAWKAAFLSEDGRVVDALQQGASHSESQGYGLLLAAIFGDDPTFDAIFGWTEANLAIRSDALLAWRWLPVSSERVPDRNNASDGDLFYAWGLVVRATRDGNRILMDRARAIAEDLVSACVVAAPDNSGRLVMMPAAQGFRRDDGIVLNPSYYMPRAMREVARATGENALATCAADGAYIIGELAKGGPVPDWIEIGPQGMFPPVDRPNRNGYEAMRVPLFMIWSGNADHRSVAVQAQAYRNDAERPPALPGQRDRDEERFTYVTAIDRKTGAVVETSDHVGYGALAALVNCAASGQAGSQIPFYRTNDQAYYPATLHLMTLIAQITASPECVPI